MCDFLKLNLVNFVWPLQNNALGDVRASLYVKGSLSIKYANYLLNMLKGLILEEKL